MQSEMTNGLLMFTDSEKMAIPHEVFLIVIEALISGIESDQTAHTFQIGSCYHHPTHPFFVPDDDHAFCDRNHLAVTPCPSNLTSSNRITPLDQHNIKPMQSRYRKTSLPAQINRWSRGKTFQTFHRVHMSLAQSGPDALVLPRIDCFNPSNLLSLPRSHNLLRQPSPRDSTLLQHVVHIFLCKPYDILQFEQDGALRNLSAFPALRQVTFGSDFLWLSMTPLHPGISPIDESPFVELWMELAFMSEKRPCIWKQFKKRGIKVFGALKSTGVVVVEVIPTEKLHMRYMNPDCTCCEREV